MQLLLNSIEFPEVFEEFHEILSVRSGRAEGAPRQRRGSAAERHGRIPKGFVLQALAAHRSSLNFMKSQRSFMELHEIST